MTRDSGDVAEDRGAQGGSGDLRPRIYRPGPIRRLREERRAALTGWVALPIHLSEVVDDTLAEVDPNRRKTVRAEIPENLIAQHGQMQVDDGAVEKSDFYHRVFSAQIRCWCRRTSSSSAGETLTLVFRGGPPS